VRSRLRRSCGDELGPRAVELDDEGTATDVARQGSDGYWRYVIDNPFGVG
jgi:hypothetical protein